MAATPSCPEKHMYLIEDARNGVFKIGRASDVKRRFGQIQSATVNPLELICTVHGAGFLEPMFHDLFRAHQVKSEWYPKDSLPVDVMIHWFATFETPAELLHSLGEAIEYCETELNNVRETAWTPDGWDDWSVANLDSFIEELERTRNEHDRRLLLIKDVREQRLKTAPPDELSVADVMQMVELAKGFRSAEEDANGQAN